MYTEAAGRIHTDGEVRMAMDASLCLPSAAYPPSPFAVFQPAQTVVAMQDGREVITTRSAGRKEYRSICDGYMAPCIVHSDRA